MKPRGCNYTKLGVMKGSMKSSFPHGHQLQPVIPNLNILMVVLLLLSPCFNCMTPDEKIELRNEARDLFIHGYDSYMKYAYPADELMPLSCKGRYRDVEFNRGDLDDALGNFSLTLIDTLDTLVILNNLTEFERAVGLISHEVTFDSDIVVSVFETNIRVLGGLLSGHVLAGYIQSKYPPLLKWYNGQLLTLAKDIGFRLLPAFNTSTGIPHPRVNLRHGMKSSKIVAVRETCSACAGTMILEFGALSRMTGEAVFEMAARKAMDYLWLQRHPGSDLVGTILNIHNGDWVRRDAGVGAGVDSYYEYLLKAYILFGDDVFLNRFNTHYNGIMKYISQGPLLVDVHMHRPTAAAKGFMDSLLAFWPGLQVLKGDLRPAVETHEMLYQVMERHNYLMPEAFSVADFGVHWAQHFMRPEFIESTYFLYKATRDDHYLDVGKKVMESLKKFTQTKCGFAAVKDIRTGSQEDRMDSFVLAETFKYLFLLFAEKSDIIINLDDFIFTTEAHLLPLSLSVTPVNMTVEQQKQSSPDTESKTELDSDEEHLKSFETCPSTHFLLQKSSKKGLTLFKEIRASLKDFVKSNSRLSPATASCPSHIRSPIHKKKRTLKLSAAEFSASNPNHLDVIRRMGIQAILLSDGRVQLIQSPSAAASEEDAEEGIQFMEEMVSISSRQLEKSEDQLRTVGFTSPKTGIKVSLPAGPAQFGPDLNSDTASVSSAAIKIDPFRGCETPSDESVVKVKGKIAIVERGDCMFVQKTRILQKLGAVGVIVIDNQPQTTASTGSMFAMSGDGESDIEIPALFLYGQEGYTLLDVIQQFPDVIIHMEPSTSFRNGAKNGRIDSDDSNHKYSSKSASSSKGVAHVTEVPNESKVDIKRLGLDDIIEQITRSVGHKYMDQIFSPTKHFSERMDQKVINEMLDDVMKKTLESFKSVLETNDYQKMKPVIQNVVMSLKNQNDDRNTIFYWMDLNDDEMRHKTCLSPLVNHKMLLRYILFGTT